MNANTETRKQPEKTLLVFSENWEEKNDIGIQEKPLLEVVKKHFAAYPLLIESDECGAEKTKEERVDYIIDTLLKTGEFDVNVNKDEVIFHLTYDPKGRPFGTPVFTLKFWSDDGDNIMESYIALPDTF